jgi:hypothetical protein
LLHQVGDGNARITSVVMPARSSSPARDRAGRCRACAAS